ncbi:ribonuclease HII [Acidihalobacter ferrooxydans]|uniref:Ribonuclease HII n=1 Tax=Acidihalobacter ferrooxydans TaxID=1765967 RepID=A0A1P8UHA0_9GAMM|nr:ribonuclease HII [Acidihalobacter ferrooxydans]APZ43225.1 ribonuclease HII [Acidihalobacter ferrooxydans]
MEQDIFRQDGHPQAGRVAGVDEAGRGPLAGPVFAAAVILDPARPIRGLADSKKLSAKRREALDAEIRAGSLAWAIAHAEVEEIDRLNILQASLLAMRRAIEALHPEPDCALIDGNRSPDGLHCQVQTIVGGDARIEAISAASILAKVARDAEMLSLHDRYPQYDFARHKGYPTALHLAALERHGPSVCHRQSFAPVRRLLREG